MAFMSNYVIYRTELATVLYILIMGTRGQRWLPRRRLNRYNIHRVSVHWLDLRVTTI